MPRLLPALFVLLAALPAAAQAPPKAPRAPLPGAVDAAEIKVRADNQGGEKGHYEFRGFVDLQAGELRIQSDKLDFFETEKPAGGVARRIVAEGNVVFLRGDERLSGDRMELDLDTGVGLFENATGYMEPGVLIEARRIERVDADSYQITDGRFTSCWQPNPRWNFSAGSARMDMNDKVVAKNVVFRVKGVPAFYLPVFAYPIQEDQRSSGLLFPHFGNSDLRGFNIGSGFFWAMSRSWDQTFLFDRWSKAGYGVGHELRYKGTQSSQGIFRTYALQPKDDRDWVYDFDWTAVQALPRKGRAAVQVRQSNDLQFQREFQENIDLFSRRDRRSSAKVDQPFKYGNLQLLADSYDTFFQTPGQDATQRTQRHLPSLQVNVNPRKLGHSGVLFGVSGKAERLGVGDDVLVENYSRLDLAPVLSRPFALSFLRVSPELRFRYTHYGALNCSDEFPCEQGFIFNDQTLGRRFAEGRVEVVGPTFFRVFSGPLSFYSEKYKHTFGPEVIFTYRTKVDRFQEIPKFEGEDYILGTNELLYALVNRLYAKRPGRSGKLEAWEFLNWRVSQTYYVNIAEGQNRFDPNYPSAFFDAEGQPTHYSPIQSRLRLMPTAGISSTFDLEYDTSFRAVRRFNLFLNARAARLTLQGGWSRFIRLDTTPARKQTDAVNGSVRAEVWPKRLTLEGSAYYDIVNKNLITSSARARYGVQCCGLMVEVVQRDYFGIKDRKISWSIDLANIGSIGNHMGQEAVENRRGYGGLF